jgi:hypothetical protein
MSLSAESLPQIRFDITEASRILRMSRATLYERVPRRQLLEFLCGLCLKELGKWPRLGVRGDVPRSLQKV